jgi:hypothetical protein
LQPGKFTADEFVLAMAEAADVLDAEIAAQLPSPKRGLCEY